MIKGTIKARRLDEAIEVSFTKAPLNEAEEGLLLLFAEAAAQPGGLPVTFIIDEHGVLKASIEFPAGSRSVRPFEKEGNK